MMFRKTDPIQAQVHGASNEILRFEKIVLGILAMAVEIYNHY
jgi:hypothetical protein